MSEYHIPAMVQESMDGLIINQDGIYVDATYGGGGHSKAILQKLSDKGRLISFDQDEQAFQNELDDNRLKLIHSNFRYISRFLRFYDISQVDGLIADLGVSSHQLDVPERGFAFRHKELHLPLDMRMSLMQTESARELLNQSDPMTLEKIFREYGEIWNAAKLVAAIREFTKKTQLETVGQLVQVASQVAVGQTNQYLAKLFQALRIAVNDELGALKCLLEESMNYLKPGGRLVIISYHSLEDRLVKHMIQTGNVEGIVRQDSFGNKLKAFHAVTKKSVQPSTQELKENYRVRSARLRIAEKSVK